MIKPIAAWIGLGLAIAFVTFAIGLPKPAQIGICAVYAIFATPIVYRQIMAATAHPTREEQ